VRAVVVGAGAWGTAFARVLLEHGHDESRFGRVSYKVSVTAPCSVMLLRETH